MNARKKLILISFLIILFAIAIAIFNNKYSLIKDFKKGDIKNNSGITFEYSKTNVVEDGVIYSIYISDQEYGLEKVEFLNDNTVIYCNGKNEISKDCKIQPNIENKIRITSKNGTTKDEIFTIERA